MARFAERVRALYPKCPLGTEQVIAEHACLKYSGRVGRSAAAKALDENAVRLAVTAHVRHAETSYDELLATGWDRHDARREVEDQRVRSPADQQPSSARAPVVPGERRRRSATIHGFDVRSAPRDPRRRG